jgi:ABC-2 type transport system permease protein
MMMVTPVLLQVLLFPFAATMEVRQNTVAIYNEDGGAASVELSQRVAKNAAFTKVINLYSQSDLIDAIDRQTALIALHFPQDFSRSLLARPQAKPAQIQIIMDGRRSNSGQIASSYISQIIGEYALASSSPPQVVVRNAFNPNLNFKWHILPCLVSIITTIGCLTITAMSVAREREAGTFEQLLVSPLTPAYIMAGKAIPGVLVATAQGSFIALAAVFFYGMPFYGSFPLLRLGMVIYALALSGIGLFLSSLCSTQQQALLCVIGFMVPAMMLSGFIGPIENMPPFLQFLARGNPLAYFIPMSKGLFLKELTFAEAIPYMWPMLLIAFFTLSAGLWIFRRHIQ